MIVPNTHWYALDAFGSVRIIRTFPTFDPATPYAGSDADIATFSAHPPFAGVVYVVGVEPLTLSGILTELNSNESDDENPVAIWVHVDPLRYQSLLLYHLKALRVPSYPV